MSEIDNPFPFFTDRRGDALDEGFVYVGEAGKDPELFPLQVFWDEELTLPAAQPLRTVAGYIVNPGAGNSAAEVFVAGAHYSIRIRDRRSVQIFYLADVYDTKVTFDDLASSDAGKGADLIGFKQDGDGAISTTVATAVKALGILPLEFGAKFDGVTDDTEALQRSIDAAAASGKTLYLPGGTALITAPLDLKGREVTIVGAGIDVCAIVASAAMPTMLDIEETTDFQDLRLKLSGFFLNGASGLADHAYRIRYRHRTSFENMRIGGCNTGGWEKDAWLSRRVNCSYDGCDTGLHLVGSNHSSSWRDCSFVGCSVEHIRIEANGTANDGNKALLFSGCDVEFGSGLGIIATGSIVAMFQSCYIGENIGGVVWEIDGAAVVMVQSGAHWFNFGGEYLAKLGVGSGRLVFSEGAAISGQGAADVGTLFRIESGTETTACKFVLDDADVFLPIGGNPTLAGDCLGTAESPPARVMAPTNPRSYGIVTTGAAAATISSPSGNVRRVTCTTAGGAFGFNANLLHSDWLVNEPLYIAVVYRSTKNVTIAVDGTPTNFGPVSQFNRITSIKLDATVSGGGPNNFSIFIDTPDAQVGDWIELYGVYLADARWHTGSPGAFRRLAKF